MTLKKNTKGGVQKRGEATYSDELSRHLRTQAKCSNETLTLGSTVLDRVIKQDTFLTHSCDDRLRNKEKCVRLRAMTVVKPHV